MKKVISSEPIPIKMWLNDIENSTLEQAKNLANLPFAFKHIALMPDTHMGYGMPIGGVLATKDVIIPNAVGVDIGCGMCAVRTNLTDISWKSLVELQKEIQKRIPVGFRRHKTPQDELLMPDVTKYRKEDLLVVAFEWENALTSLGTLGGGNHFIEIQKGDDGFIWIMIHSGSRNLGKKVADHYNSVAKHLNQKWYSAVPSSHQLAFLPLDTEETYRYQAEMQYCVDYAFANRRLMMNRIQQIIKRMTSNVEFGEIINVAHNYARTEHHFKTNVKVHRKGATSACEGEIGIIPGSQGTSSYIVKGKGNSESFESCSHGAGRAMSRKQARRELDLNQEVHQMDEQGIVHRMTSQDDLDEAAGAYKPIDEVMENQKDLVKILVKLKPLMVIKG